MEILRKAFTRGKRSLRKATNRIKRTVRRLVCGIRSLFKRKQTRKRPSLREDGSDQIAYLRKEIRKYREQNVQSKIRLIETSDIFNYDSTVVDFFVIDKGSVVAIAEGWTTELLEQTEGYDKYIVHSEMGTKLPVHSHIQRETIKLIKGKCKIIEYDTNGTVIREEILERGDVVEERIYEIEPLTLHEVVSLRDCVMVVTFRPPLNIKIEDNEYISA